MQESLRKEVMGHERIETTQMYTHLRPVHQIAAHEQLSQAIPIEEFVTKPGRRARGKSRGTLHGRVEKSQ